MDVETLTIIGTVIGTVLAVGVALAGLIIRSTARLDADRRATQARFDADQRAVQARFDADQRAVQARFDAVMDAGRTEMNAFRAEMLRLAERQSHVEGRFDERGAPAD